MDHTSLSESPFVRGMGTSRENFFEEIRRRLPDIDPEEATISVFSALGARLSGSVDWEILRELPPDLRIFFQHYVKPAAANAEGFDREEFYERVAQQLNRQTDDVRRVISAVFAALHTQITDATAHSIASQLPSDLASTFAAARHRADKPRME